VADYLPALSLYIHLPWCVRKCPYCDFNSHRAGDNPPRRRYIDALKRDLQNEVPRAEQRTIVSIFLGGGTPSLFTADEIAEVLEECGKQFQLADDCEITMEANPGTVERGTLVHYRQAGVNRLSLGAQSFSADTLGVLGRIHSPDDIRTAYDEAVCAEFNSINIDLMFALPGQDLQGAIADVDALLELDPPHISYYQLTLEQNTVFYKRPPDGMPDEDLAWQIQEACHERLQRAGFEQYEISAFAKGGHRCKHNLNYWNFGDYLAVGAGAHGKMTVDGQPAYRYQKPANPQVFMEWAEDTESQPKTEIIRGKDVGFEFMLNALRLTDGFTASAFREQTGSDIGALEKPLMQAEADGLIERRDVDRWCPTETGFRFLNDLQARFLN